ncbi:helix-turn-helix domain-containing protein [Chryseobacterium sp. A321]
MTKIGDIIRIKRIEMGITQKGLASQIGVDVSFLCKIEKNEKNISLNNLLKINKILLFNNDDLKIIFYSKKLVDMLNDESEVFKIKVLEFLQKKIKNNEI